MKTCTTPAPTGVPRAAGRVRPGPRTASPRRRPTSRPRMRPRAGSTWPSPASATTSSTAATACWSSTSITATASSSGSRRPGSTTRGSRSTSRGSAPAPITERLYISTIKQLMCLDLVSEKLLWERTYDQGCDRMAITPDGQTIFLPSFEGPLWYVVRAEDGEVIARITPEIGLAQHDRRPGREESLSRRPELAVLDDRRHADAPGRPLGRSVRREHPPVHDQRRPDALLRERQPTARLRGRRPEDRREAVSGRGGRISAGADQAARLPQPWDRR